MIDALKLELLWFLRSLSSASADPGSSPARSSDLRHRYIYTTSFLWVDNDKRKLSIAPYLQSNRSLSSNNNMVVCRTYCPWWSWSLLDSDTGSENTVRHHIPPPLYTCSRLADPDHTDICSPSIDSWSYKHRKPRYIHAHFPVSAHISSFERNRNSLATDPSVPGCLYGTAPRGSSLSWG